MARVMGAELGPNANDRAHWCLRRAGQWWGVGAMHWAGQPKPLISTCCYIKKEQHFILATPFCSVLRLAGLEVAGVPTFHLWAFRRCTTFSTISTSVACSTTTMAFSPSCRQCSTYTSRGKAGTVRGHCSLLAAWIQPRHCGCMQKLWQPQLFPRWRQQQQPAEPATMLQVGGLCASAHHLNELLILVAIHHEVAAARGVSVCAALPRGASLGGQQAHCDAQLSLGSCLQPKGVVLA